jgi:hypothetical protein
MEEWIKRIDDVRVRVERLAKLALKEKQFDSMAAHHLSIAANELDRAQEQVELQASRAARPSARRGKRK